MKACIVSGSRDWEDSEKIAKALEAFKPDVLIHGDCRGADRLAGEIMQGKCEIVRMPAQWDRDGKAAGPVRNTRMLDVLLALQDCGYVVAVLAFPLPQSRGTKNMMLQANRDGVQVIEVAP